MRTSSRAFAWFLPALALALLFTGCATDENPPPSRVETQPVVAQPMPVAEPAPTERPAPVNREVARAQPVNTAFVYNRVLAKLEDPAAVDLEAFQRAVEERTGARVKEIRTGAMGLLSIVFEEADPPRGEEEQRALVESLKGMPELRYAEPERLLKAH